MVLTTDEPKKNRKPLVSTDKFSIIAVEKTESNLITGFTVTNKKTKREQYIPVINGQYWKAWTSVYSIIKPLLK
jgi:hypothetical protein